MSWNTVAYIGFGLIVFGAVLAFKEHLWLSKEQVGEGVIVELIHSRSRKGGSYSPRVAFRATDGTQHEFKRGYSSNPAGFVKGEQVAVAYDPETYDARILTFGQRFGLPVILASIGLGMICMSGAYLAGAKLVPRIYQDRAAGTVLEPL